jgi:hypothetical protein
MRRDVLFVGPNDTQTLTHHGARYLEVDEVISAAYSRSIS